MEIDNRTDYDLLKEKTKVLASKYPIGNQFIKRDIINNKK